MPLEKFDQHEAGGYWKKYFESNPEYNAAMSEHLDAALREKQNSVGLDVGSGPGVGAKLLDTLGIETTLTGYEPSKTSADAVKLSEELEKNRSKVKYHPINAGIKDIPTPEKDSLDYLLVLRAAHEIAESLGGHDKFFEEFDRLMAGLKDEGKIIIAEPQFARHAYDKPELIEMVRKQREFQIGHSHIPTDYIADDELRAHMESKSYSLTKETILPDEKLLEYLKNNGLDIDQPPCYYYVHTYEKQQPDKA